MNHYRHMMEQVALSGRKKEEIMEQLEMKETQKRRMPKAGKLILAAALAVGCVLSIAAGLPARVYNFATGGQIYMVPGTNESRVSISIGGDETAPIKAEDGRLWLEVDGQRLDITDKVDENTPYIYERTDPVTGEKGLMVVGGTVEDFGWIEYFIIDGSIQAGSGRNYFECLTELPDGSEVSLFDLTDEQREQLADEGSKVSVITDGEVNEDIGITGRIVNRPWYQAAMDQLGLNE